MKPKYFKDFTQEELIKIINEEREKNTKLKSELKSELKKQRIKILHKLFQENVKKTKPKSKSITKINPRPRSRPKSKSITKLKPKSKQKIKTFDEYFQECIKNKTIPKNTPLYLKKALERTLKEHEEGIILDKSALANFAEKYNIEGIPGILPFHYFGEKASQIKDFLRNHRNTIVRLLLICEMEKQNSIGKDAKLISYARDKAYFHSKTYINLEKTNVKVFLKEMIKEILENIDIYQKNGSGWYFKEVIRLEIHIVEYKPMNGGSYIPLPEIIKKKKCNN